MMKKIGFIGMGNMAKAMVTGILRSGKIEANQIYAFAPNQEKLRKNGAEMGFHSCQTATEVVRQCDLLVMACKPYQIEGVLSELGGALDDKALVSLAAGWNYADYREKLEPSTRVQCIMPNTAVSVGEGVILMESESSFTEADRKELKELFSGCGLLMEFPTRLMGAAGGLSGCGVAFMDMIIEALGDGAVKNGVSRGDAYLLASQVMIGAAKLQLESGLHPGELKDQVCSPGGITIKGVSVLEEEGLRSALIKAIDAVS